MSPFFEELGNRKIHDCYQIQRSPWSPPWSWLTMLLTYLRQEPSFMTPSLYQPCPVSPPLAVWTNHLGGVLFLLAYWVWYDTPSVTVMAPRIPWEWPRVSCVRSGAWGGRGRPRAGRTGCAGRTCPASAGWTPWMAPWIWWSRRCGRCLAVYAWLFRRLGLVICLRFFLNK